MIPRILNGAFIQKPVFSGMFSQAAIREVPEPVFPFAFVDGGQ
jgi:hypothetical protein